MTQYEKGFEDCKKQVKVAMVAAVENAILMEREACARRGSLTAPPPKHLRAISKMLKRQTAADKRG